MSAMLLKNESYHCDKCEVLSLNWCRCTGHPIVLHGNCPTEQEQQRWYVGGGMCDLPTGG